MPTPLTALVVTNMWPSPDRPALGRFVADQVAALRRLPGVSVEVFAFTGGGVDAYLRAAALARREFRGRRFDVVHAHFGLSAWPALAVAADVRALTLHGTDLAHPRSRAVTLAALKRFELVGAVSAELAATVPRRALARNRAVQVLPCGVDLERFQPIDRREARGLLGLPAEQPCLLLPSDPRRPEKRADLAGLLARSLRVPLLSLGQVTPEQVPLFVNAASAVLIPSEREGFGLACLEALACDVPVLSTAHGVAPAALAGIPGTLCGPFELARWRAVAGAAVAQHDPRVPGRAVASAYSADAMAAWVLAAWGDAGR